MFLPVSFNSSEVPCGFMGVRQKRGTKYSCSPVLHHWCFGIKLQIFSQYKLVWERKRGPFVISMQD